MIYLYRYMIYVYHIIYLCYVLYYMSFIVSSILSKLVEIHITPCLYLIKGGNSTTSSIRAFPPQFSVGFFFRSPTQATGEKPFSWWKFLGFFGMKVLVCFSLIHSSIPFASHFRWGQFLCVWFLWKIFLFKFTELENVLVNHSQRIARME